MGATWLDDLPDVVASTGLRWRLWEGWETRARSSGGYDAVYAVFCHHTASDTTPDSDCRWMWHNSPDRPVGALYLDRAGQVTIGAAGATNTQGKGGPWTLSRGTIPQDKGNGYGIAIEAANNGVGEPWPDDQCSAYTALCKALCEAYGLDPARDCLSHAEWCAPSCDGRKVDPAGPSPWADSGTWNMDLFRADVCDTEPPESEDTVTQADIDEIVTRTTDAVLAKVGGKVWTYPLGDITTGEMNEAGDIMRSGANQAHIANK